MQAARPLNVLRRLLVATSALLLLAGCRPMPIQEQQSYVFGTRVEVLVVSPEADTARRAIAAVLAEFDRLHRAYHAWQDSELTALNADIAAGKPHRVSPELAALIRDAQQMSARGDYLFDPGIGKLIALWGFQNDEFKAQLPDPKALAAWRAAHPSIADLKISDDDVVTSRNRQVALDFGGYLKGVALDRATAILRAQGIRDALINIGGNIMALGSKEGRKWRIGIQHPRQSAPLATLELDDGEAIGSSGDYQRFFELDGRRYPHLIDPRTAEPVEHTQAVTVLIPAGPRAGTLSDGTSKPIFIAGPQHWREQARKEEIGLVLRVDRDGTIQMTRAMAERAKIADGAGKVEIVD